LAGNQWKSGTEILNCSLIFNNMATSKNPLWAGWKGPRGSVSKQVVIKQYDDKTVFTKYPDMTAIIPSAPQKENRNKFAEAIAYAKEIIADPVKKANFPVGGARNVYQAAIKHYLKEIG
jgi:hypothetical protein